MSKELRNTVQVAILALMIALVITTLSGCAIAPAGLSNLTLAAGATCAACRRREGAQERYENRLSLLHGDRVTCLGEYKTKKDKIKHRCNDCGYEWDVVPDSFLYSTGKRHVCPSCSDKVPVTTESYRAELKELSASTICIGEYVNSDTSVEHMCLKCSHTWSTRRERALAAGAKCTNCEGLKENKIKGIEYAKRLKCREISVLGQYKGNKGKIEHLCHNCGNTWKTRPNSILNGSGCPSCAVGGFDPAKPGTLYYLIAPDKSETKIGITNFTVEERFSRRSLAGFQCFTLHFSDGKRCRGAEAYLHSKFDSTRKQSETLKKYGGFTEWFSGDPLRLDGLRDENFSDRLQALREHFL